MLTEGRSGSTWLTQLSNATGVMGQGGEWFSRSVAKERLAGVKSGPEYLERFIASSSGGGEVFSSKVFPGHHQRFFRKYGLDIVRELTTRHDVLCILLKRRDTLGQAISFARARQSGKWIGAQDQKKSPEYDFEEICRCFIRIHRSSDYWDSYVSLRNLPALHMTYEELLPDGADYLNAIADHCGIDGLDIPESETVVQRNSQSERWRERFLEEIGDRDIMPYLEDPLTIADRARLMLRGTKH